MYKDKIFHKRTPVTEEEIKEDIKEMGLTGFIRKAKKEALAKKQPYIVIGNKSFTKVVPENGTALARGTKLLFFVNYKKTEFVDYILGE